jgi:hypothetical protein
MHRSVIQAGLFRSLFVLDLFFLAVGIGFFAAALAYVSACDRL